MKKFIKKSVSILLIVAVMFASSSFSGLAGKNILDIFGLENLFFKSSAATVNGYCGDNLTWTYDTVTHELVIKGTGDMDNWDTYKNAPPWKNYENIVSVVINEGVKSIGDYAFYRFEYITTVSFPDSLKTIGKYSFYQCRSIVDIDFGDNVISIGESAFEYCTNITALYLPSKLQTIDYCAFAGCFDLKTVYVPSNVISINTNAFMSCNALTSFYVDYNNQFYSSDNYGVLFNKNKTEIVRYPIGNTRKSYQIPNTVKIIGDHSFTSAENLTNIIIPEGVVTIEHYAFTLCKKLEHLIIPNTVETISYFAFNSCEKLVFAHIPSSVTYIDGYNFNGTRVVICCDTEDSYTKEFTERDGLRFRLCYGHGSDGHPHTPGEWITEIEPDCTNGGIRKNYCTECSVLTVTEEIDALGHDYSSEITEPTCTEIGYTTYVCTLCKDTYTDNETSALGHDIVIDEYVAATCTKTGLTKGQHCSRCDEETVEQKVIPVIAHKKGDAVTENVIEAECGKNGTYESVVYCTVCGNEISREAKSTDALKHQYEKVTTAPTCTEIGYTTYTCRLCSDTYTSDETDALGHDIVIDKSVDATCTKTGLTEGRHCTRCNDETIKQIVIPVIPHKSGNAVIENNTKTECDKEGSYDSVIYCTVCKNELSRETIVVKASEHTYDKQITAPTCTEKGYTTYTCSVCNHSHTADERNSLGHDIIILKAVEATCTETGLSEGRYCSRCDDITVKQEVTPLKSHSYEIKSNHAKHWKECVCGSKIDERNHYFTDGTNCSCGYKAESKATLKILNNSGSKTINYGETLKLTATVNYRPENAIVYWFVDGVKRGEGDVFSLSFESGIKIVTAKLVDSNGNVLTDANGNEISDSESVTVKGGFFQKIISFFKNLFGMNRIVIQKSAEKSD